jgi:hypothetical protein
MNDIRSVVLDLVRAGPAHNQLLSPLTAYLALCGAEGPVTITMPFEQRQLLHRLARLRYVTDKGEGIPAEQREAEVRELGEDLGRVLAGVPALFSELGDARDDTGGMVHLRLSLSPSELGMVPFELAVGPDGFPASGSPLFLQTRTPVTVTREIRRGRPLAIDWNQPPRILFAYAAPGAGFAEVPANDHLRALRDAIDPWIEWSERPEERVAKVKAMLTVLPNASLEAIRDACAATAFTHVHILAHGAPIDGDESRRYGVALAAGSTGRPYDVVDGERLAIALTTRDVHGIARHRPTVVTLATCDSGNEGTSITPGGSIVHELHASGIPWVIGSQFPLWVRASSVAARILYAGLLRGDDPRWVLYALRQHLRTDFPGTHDWASIVAYASIPENFGKQVAAFRDHQTKRMTDVKFAKADRLANRTPEHAQQLLRDLCGSIRQDFAEWCAELAADAPAGVRSDRFATSGAAEKRIAILYTIAGKKLEAKEAKGLARDAYRRALEFYAKAKDEDWNFWAMSQFLSVLAIPDVTPDDDLLKLHAQEYRGLWQLARQIAEWKLVRGVGLDRVWALATLSELALLGSIYDAADFDEAAAIDEIRSKLVKLRQIAFPDPFPLQSTRRQFERYLLYWPRKQWNRLAEAALEAIDGTKDTSAGSAAEAPAAAAPDVLPQRSRRKGNARPDRTGNSATPAASPASPADTTAAVAAPLSRTVD